jgi:hypothetical protein
MIGNKNAHKVWFVSAGADGKSMASMTDISSTHRDLEFEKGMLACGDRICQNWNMPPTILGRGGKADRTLGETDLQLYNETCVDTRMMNLAEQHNRQLLHEFNDTENHVLGYISPVRETKELEAQKANDGLTRGGTTLNEYRKARGEDPFPGEIGDGITLPANTILVSSKSSVEEVQKLLAERSGKTAPEGTAHPSTPTSPGNSSFTPASELSAVTQSVSGSRALGGLSGQHVVALGGMRQVGIISKRAPVAKSAPAPLSAEAVDYLYEALVGSNGNGKAH